MKKIISLLMIFCMLTSVFASLSVYAQNSNDGDVSASDYEKIYMDFVKENPDTSKGFFDGTSGIMLADVDRNGIPEMFAFSTTNAYLDKDGNLFLPEDESTAAKIVVRHELTRGLTIIEGKTVEDSPWRGEDGWSEVLEMNELPGESDTFYTGVVAVNGESRLMLYNDPQYPFDKYSDGSEIPDNVSEIWYDDEGLEYSIKGSPRKEDYADYALTDEPVVAMHFYDDKLKTLRSVEETMTKVLEIYKAEKQPTNHGSNASKNYYIEGHEVFSILGSESFCDNQEDVEYETIYIEGKCTLKVANDPAVDVKVFSVAKDTTIKQFVEERRYAENLPEYHLYNDGIHESIELDEGAYILYVGCAGYGYYTQLVIGDSKKEPIQSSWKISDWAKAEIDEAMSADLVPQMLLNTDMTENIDRREFAALAVNLYEIVTGESVQYSANPFVDIKSDDVEIKKAYELDITTGVSETLFDPDSSISREQLATMLCRVYKKYKFEDWCIENDSEYQFDIDLSSPYSRFLDHDEISEYAVNSIYFLQSKGVVRGIGGRMFAPKPIGEFGCASREEAVIMVLRCYKNLFLGMDPYMN